MKNLRINLTLWRSCSGLWVGFAPVSEYSGYILASRHYPWSLTWSWAVYWNPPWPRRYYSHGRGTGRHWGEWFCGLWRLGFHIARQAEMINEDQMEADILKAFVEQSK